MSIGDLRLNEEISSKPLEWSFGLLVHAPVMSDSVVGS